MNPLAPTSPPTSIAVVFSSIRTSEDDAGYAQMAERMVELARTMPGFQGVESARGSDGFGITVSYWQSEEAVRHWYEQAEHRTAQQLGRERWYEAFEMRICRVERAYGFRRDRGGS